MRKPLLYLKLSVFILMGASSSHAEPPFLRVGMEDEPTSLAWNNPSPVSEQQIVPFLMRGLLKLDPNGAPVCDLCKSFSAVAEGKAYRFEFSGEVWSDGTRLEASHFVDALERLRGAADFLFLGEIRAEGNSILEIKLKESNPLFLYWLTRPATFPIRKEFLNRPGGLARGPVLGPYRLVEWEPGKRIVIEANSRYPGELPVQQVNFTIGKYPQLLQAFRRNRIDVLANPTTNDLIAIKATQEKIQVNHFLGVRWLGFNVRSYPLSELGARRAILYSLDRNALRGLLNRGERAATGLLPPGIQGYRAQTLTGLERDRAIRELGKNPESVFKRPLTLLTTDLPTDQLISDWLAKQLATLKIQIKRRAESESRFYKSLEKGDYDLVLRNWSFKVASPLEMLKIFRTDDRENTGHWTSVGYDATLAQLLRTTDPSLVSKPLDEALQILEVQEVAAVALSYPSPSFLLGPRVKSFSITQFGDPNLVAIKVLGLGESK